ncbi:MAG: 3-phosphoshikimate 1-carboxyvinyltransferase [Eggerthellaceae bacterium]|nr:3-phosphoshikimate 1-carboxyvinyltransferase [Eggerthellaceae bacterium]
MDKPAPLIGSIIVPGDKSIAHRAVFFAALSQGVTRIIGLPEGSDVRASLNAIESLGAKVSLAVDGNGITVVEVEGWGDMGPKPRVSEDVLMLDCGNSGTTARFLLGMLSGYPITVRLDGDASLTTRPMKRLLDPLCSMGLSCISSSWPIEIRGEEPLKPIPFELPVASAQMKTALLFAAMRADGTSRIIEPALSRDHTERLAEAFGIRIEKLSSEHGFEVTGPIAPCAPDVPIAIPGDFSSAAFWITAALCIPGSDLTIEGVGLNPTRLGFIDALQAMGANVSVERIDDLSSEPYGRIRAIYTGRLRPCETVACDSAMLIDEAPVLAIMCARAMGKSLLRNIGELALKECDRLNAIIEALSACGVKARAIENEDGSTDLLICGNGELSVSDGTKASAYRDHRIAMMWAVLSAICHAQVQLDAKDIDSISVSYPGFLDEFSQRLGYAPIVRFE